MLNNKLFISSATIILLMCLLSFGLLYSQDFEAHSGKNVKNVELVIPTYLGNQARHFYGNQAPSALDLIWKFYMGKGKTVISKKIGEKEWAGSGWTGQVLIVRENEQLYLIHGALDHHLRKIDARDGSEIWRYKFDDVIKGTGTIWINQAARFLEESVIILQGSRRGLKNDLFSRYVPSFRAVSYYSGKELWRMNSKRTPSYSRDVDGSALIYQDLAYIGLENALFTVFNPDPRHAAIRDGMMQPKILQQLALFDRKDQVKHGGNLVTESSPALIGQTIWITAGSGHVYGYDLNRRELGWDFYIGSDLDGSPVVTGDQHLLITVEKQYIDGQGGIFKLDPSSAPHQSVVWFFPTEDDSVESWQGGVIGSACVNDATKSDADPSLAAFVGIDGNLYVVRHDQIDHDKGFVNGPQNKNRYPAPKLIFKSKIGPSISTPIIVKNKLIAAGYKGLYLYEFNRDLKFTLLARFNRCAFESTPVVHNGRIYIGAKDGYLYCFGDNRKF